MQNKANVQKEMSDSYLVVTEHWPRNPSSPMKLLVETRPIELKSVSVQIEVAKMRRKESKSKCIGKTFAVKILEESEY